MKPTTGIAACCARAASGHAPATRSLMKSRRLMQGLQPDDHSLSHQDGSCCALKTRAVVHYRKTAPVMSVDGPAVLRPRQHAKLARGSEDKEHAITHQSNCAIAMAGRRRWVHPRARRPKRALALAWAGLWLVIGSNIRTSMRYRAARRRPPAPGGAPP